MKAEKKQQRQEKRQQRRARAAERKERRLAVRAAISPQERKRRRRRILLNWVFYLLGSAIYALSMSAVAAPNKIAPGGISGITTMLNYGFGLPIGLMYLALNVPIIILGWAKLGGRFIFKTACVVLICSAFTDFFDVFVPDIVLQEPLMASLVGGALAGVGLGMVFMRGATTGGTDVLARVLERKFRHVPIGKLLLALDAGVVATSALVYGSIEHALYAAVFIFVSSTAIDALVTGSDAGKMLLIATSNEKATADAIMQKLGRGVTYLQAEGAYTDTPRRLLMVAARRTDVFPIKQIVYQIDASAFVITLTTDEVLGEGFKQVSQL